MILTAKWDQFAANRIVAIDRDAPSVTSCLPSWRSQSASIIGCISRQSATADWISRSILIDDELISNACEQNEPLRIRRSGFPKILVFLALLHSSCRSVVDRCATVRWHNYLFWRIPIERPLSALIKRSYCPPRTTLSSFRLDGNYAITTRARSLSLSN